MGVNSFKTKGWCGYRSSGGTNHSQNGQTALRRDKEEARLPSAPNTISGAFHGTQTEAMCPEMDLLGSPGLRPEGPIN